MLACRERAPEETVVLCCLRVLLWQLHRVSPVLPELQISKGLAHVAVQGIGVIRCLAELLGWLNREVLGPSDNSSGAPRSFIGECGAGGRLTGGVLYSLDFFGGHWRRCIG